VTGYLVPAGQPKALAAKLSELLADPGVRKRMGEAGRARMHARFTFSAQAAAYLDLFARLRPSPVEVAA